MELAVLYDQALLNMNTLIEVHVCTHKSGKEDHYHCCYIDCGHVHFCTNVGALLVYNKL